MPIFSDSPKRFYLLGHCFACKEVMRMPMHNMQRRHYGMVRVHAACFDEELFRSFETDNIVVLESRSDRVSEHNAIRNYANSSRFKLVRSEMDKDEQ